MNKLADYIIPLLAVCLLVVCSMLGVLDLTVGNLIVLAIVAVASAYIGIMLGRRSKTANLYADKVQAEIREIEARTKSTLAHLSATFPSTDNREIQAE